MGLRKRFRRKLNSRKWKAPISIYYHTGSQKSISSYRVKRPACVHIDATKSISLNTYNVYLSVIYIYAMCDLFVYYIRRFRFPVSVLCFNSCLWVVLWALEGFANSFTRMCLLFISTECY
ncbi:hypothetical protein GYMLUDRAFT_470788 [Collybiopsis luxurians FD-317 M1]|uniref:Uncharacterized protein n=1 Tax=Collybiopsis luxurians FD-317 M1 TaxID=944289 RepID=A0A0D0CJF7_9AGAR|nr:hypothetical protein GYMLUDRAFT_470788 [Collybiopsis luxurians FD-317 M1]